MRDLGQRRPRTIGRRAFTLIEVLIVILIAGVLAIVALPRFESMRQSALVEQAAQQLVGDLRRTQVDAIRRNVSLDFVRSNTTTYVIDTIGTRTLPAGATFSVGSATNLTFAAFGPPSSGGGSFAISAGSKLRTVTVGANGLVSVQ